MNDRARRIANLTPEKRRLLEQMLQKRAQAHPRERPDDGIETLPRYSESGQPRVFPLSSAQRLMWFNEQQYPGAHNMPAHALRLRGPLDVAALDASLHEVCTRHEALRTTFGTHHGEPVQIVGPPRSVSLARVDLGGRSPETRETDVRRLVDAESRRPFDLSRDLMLRATLVRLDDEEHVLVLVMHHIACDGQSVNVLFEELSALYNALRVGGRADLPQLSVQYVDYVVWLWHRLRAGELRRLLGYWNKQLANAPVALHMPIGQPPLWPSRASKGTSQELRMPARLAHELHAFSRRQNVTLFMTLLAAWVALLHRYSGEEDILIGTHTANRNRPELEGLIGCFTSYLLVLRHDLGGDPPFTELLRRVRKTALDAFSHSDLPVEIVRKDLYVDCDIGFTLQSVAHTGPNLDDLQVERIKAASGARTSFLRLVMTQRDKDLTAKLSYNTYIFQAATIERMLENLQSLLEGIVADPEEHISRLPLKTGVDVPVHPAWPKSRSIRFRKRLRWGIRQARKELGRFIRAGQAWPLVGSLFARTERMSGRLLSPMVTEPFRMPTAGLPIGSNQTQAGSPRGE